MRQVALDTETTGMNKKRGHDVSDGHRIIEIGLVEIVDGVVTGKKFHSFVNPQMPVDHKAFLVHGISDDFLSDKPLFKDIARKVIEFIGDSVILIHNAEFDVSFLNKEFEMIREEDQPQGKTFKVLDTLKLARRKCSVANNTLTALCDTFGIPYSKGHSALEDAEMLAKLYVRILS